MSSLIRKPLDNALILAAECDESGTDVEPLHGSLSTDVNSLHPDFGRKRRAPEIETQCASGPGIHTVCGFQ